MAEDKNGDVPQRAAAPPGNPQPVPESDDDGDSAEALIESMRLDLERAKRESSERIRRIMLEMDRRWRTNCT